MDRIEQTIFKMSEEEKKPKVENEEEEEDFDFDFSKKKKKKKAAAPAPSNGNFLKRIGFFFVFFSFFKHNTSFSLNLLLK